MKLGICGDVHFCKYSSIVRSRGKKYSTRIENLIKSVNWFEHLCEENNCDIAVYLGDFFDQSDLDAESITALQEIKWSNIRHYMIVGNHEMGRSNLELSSAHLFALIPQCEVIDFPHVINESNDTSLMFLPYVLEKDRKPLKEYFDGIELCNNKIIFSHNDISGIQMGKFISTTGFSIEDIEENCNLFINGHLHNGTEIGNKIINVGNITGQNFSEDAFTYSHKAYILDTDEKSLEPIDNRHAMNFYKIDFTNLRPIIDDVKIQNTLSSLKYPAVATIKITSDIEFIVRDLLTTCDNILECRIIKENLSEINPIDTIEDDFSIDHIKKFQQYVYDNLGTSELMLNELERVSK